MIGAEENTADWPRGESQSDKTARWIERVAKAFIAFVGFCIILTVMRLLRMAGISEFESACGILVIYLEYFLATLIQNNQLRSSATQELIRYVLYELRRPKGNPAE